jgi:hypothetical protein
VLRQFAGPVLLTVVVAVAVAACGSAPSSAPPPSSEPQTEPSVAATWVADDGSVVALNVVLARDTDRGRLLELARGFRHEHPEARVIVRFFMSTAGQDRFVIGYIPTDGGPLPSGAGPATALATFDFPAPMPTATDGER